MNIPFSNSTPCLKSELDLFSSNPLNTSILKSSIISYPTTIPLEGTEDTFVIEIPAGEEYIDLNDIFLEVDVTIPNINSTTQIASETPEIGPVNNFIHSLFRNIEVEIGPPMHLTHIESVHNYPYKAHLLNVTSYNEEVKSTWLKNGMWEMDEAGKFDLATNKGFVKRKKIFVDGGSSCKLIAPLACDIFTSPKLLPGRYQINVTFKKSDDKFRLMGKHYLHFNAKITKAQLLVRRCLINSTIVKAHETALLQGPFKYPLTSTRLFNAFIGSGRSDYVAPSFLSTIPNKVLLCFVKDSSFFGNGDNPFNYGHFNVSKITLVVDSKEHYININPTKKDCVEAYHAFFQSNNLYNRGSIGINHEDFLGGTCLFSFNLMPDKGCEFQFNQQRTGSMVIKVEFSESTTVALRLICLFTYDNEINFDFKGNVWLANSVG